MSTNVLTAPIRRTIAMPVASRWAGLVIACVGLTMTFLNITATTSALTPIEADLHATSAEFVWVASTYTLVVASLVLSAGTLGDILGRRTVFAAGTATMGLGEPDRVPRRRADRGHRGPGRHGRRRGAHPAQQPGDRHTRVHRRARGHDRREHLGGDLGRRPRDRAARGGWAARGVLVAQRVPRERRAGRGRSRPDPGARARQPRSRTATSTRPGCF